MMKAQCTITEFDEAGDVTSSVMFSTKVDDLREDYGDCVVDAILDALDATAGGLAAELVAEMVSQTGYRDGFSEYPDPAVVQAGEDLVDAAERFKQTMADWRQRATALTCYPPNPDSNPDSNGRH